MYSIGRDRARALSGDQKAWPNMMDWVRYHHSSFSNAMIACAIQAHQTTDESFLDVCSKYFLQISVVYRHDPNLAIQQKFELRGTHLVRRDDPMAQFIAPRAEMGLNGAVLRAKKEYGDAYAGTGSYLVIAMFRPDDAPPGQDGVPFVKHFGIDQDHSRARLACLDPMQQLQANILSGKKMRFCCGRSPKDDTCCCGGWTHELMRSEAAARSMSIRDDEAA